MRRGQRAGASAIAVLLLWAAACGRDEGAAAADAGSEPAPATGIVARVGEEAIAAEELDAPLRLRLYDLDEAKYRLRRERLDRLVADRLVAVGEATPEQVEAALAAGEVELLLAPPGRPRLDVGAGDLPVRGADDAPVALVVFCDFASVHCARIQPALRRLLEDYEGLVAVAHRDHPLPFHRRARPAAEAARCAHEQDAFWRYHDALYLEPERLDRARLEALARALALDLASFRDCLASGRTRDAVDADARAARALGLRNAPVTFVNGLYLKGPASEETFRSLVEGELAARGIEPPDASERATPRRGDLPLVVVGTVVGRDPESSLAAFESETWQATRVFRPGEEVMEGVTLHRVESRGVLVRHADGATEFLPLAPGAAQAGAETPLRIGEGAGGVLRLSREAVDRALEDREALERRLAPGRLDVEGHHLLKLQEIEPGSLYEALGLMPGDVIMQVDGVFVHDGYNPLWEALRTRSELTVTVMRGGFPKTFSYAIE